MTILKGDRVRLRTGEIGLVVDVWGVARTWIKVDTGNSHVICMADAVEWIIAREQQRRKWR